jgi:hypothetical protein
MVNLCPAGDEVYLRNQSGFVHRAERGPAAKNISGE